MSLDLTALRDAMTQLQDAVRYARGDLARGEPNPAAIDEMDFNGLIRRAYAVGLLGAELAVWQGFRRNRRTTSHAYDKAKAASVFDAIPAFLAEVEFMTARLDERGSRP